MKVLVEVTKEQKEEIIGNKKAARETGYHFVNDTSEVVNYSTFDAFFFLKPGVPRIDFPYHYDRPVIVNSVIETLEELGSPKNFSRINGWPGFLKRSVWEVATMQKDGIEKIFRDLDWPVVLLKDETGLVAARVLSMIINEAHYTLGEKISTRAEIDTAMKLGTNYPFGPFEWAEKIGIDNIYKLLKKLSLTERRYLPAPLLTQRVEESSTSDC